MAVASSDPARRSSWRESRTLSAAEFILGAGIVLGSNVFDVLPNEVFILCFIGLASIWWRNGTWSALGFRRPASWWRLLWIALAAAAVRLILGAAVIDPVTERFWPPAAAPEGVDAITGNLKVALMWLGLVWTFAAFGEEIAYRGYLLTRGAEAGGGSTAAYLVAVVLVAILFGYGHYYKGPAGIIDSGVAGLILGLAYLAAGRNLWACILAHGFIDTTVIVLLYFGLVD